MTRPVPLVGRLLPSIGSLVLLASIFLPWWSLGSTIVNGRVSAFTFQISPTGFGVNTPVGNASNLLEPLAIASLIVGIVEFPLWSGLVMGAFNGFYCAFRRRQGVRLLIGPLWGMIALTWWAIYFLAIYGFFGSLGLNIPPTGSASITWRNYTLGSATWGWDSGFWLAIVGTALLLVGALLSIRGTGFHAKRAGSSFSRHSYLLFFLAFLNFMFMLVLFVTLKSPGVATLITLPVVMLVAMGFFARHPRAATAGRIDIPVG